MKTFNVMLMALTSLLYAQASSAQAGSFDAKDKFFNISIDNDYFNYRGKGTDRYYTSGTFLSYLYERPHKSKQHLFSKALQQPVRRFNVISLSQMLNTPHDIRETGILPNDYPYAGVLFLSMGNLQLSEKSSTAHNISIGSMGPNALGDQTQTTVHRLIRYTLPQGWDNQINNEWLLQFNMKHRQLLFQEQDFLKVWGYDELNAGTIFNNVTAGINVQLGWVNHGLATPLSQGKKSSFFLFTNLQATAVLYNGMLQGGIRKQIDPDYHRQSSYIIQASELNRGVVKLNFGLQYIGPKIGLSIGQFIQSADFKSVRGHEYGNISFSVRI